MNGFVAQIREQLLQARYDAGNLAPGVDETPQETALAEALLALDSLEEQLEAAQQFGHDMRALAKIEESGRLALLEAVPEKVARALYEKAMEERRTCLPRFQQDKRWDDAPYVPPLREGESRPSNWRDPWREQAVYFLSDSYPARES